MTGTQEISRIATKETRAKRPVVCAVDDEKAVLQAIHAALAQLDVEVKCYLSAEDFLGEYRPGAVACMLIDYVLPGASGLDLLERLQSDPVIQVVMISGQGTISSAVNAMKSGAIEYLEKPYEISSLLGAVENAIDRNNQACAKLQAQNQRQSRLEGLTRAERDVVEASATGDSIKEIAGKLDISIRTVHMRLASAMKKTETDNKIELIKLICYPEA